MRQRSLLLGMKLNVTSSAESWREMDEVEVADAPNLDGEQGVCFKTQSIHFLSLGVEEVQFCCNTSTNR